MWTVAGSRRKEKQRRKRQGARRTRSRTRIRDIMGMKKELKEIFERTHGRSRRKSAPLTKEDYPGSPSLLFRTKCRQKEKTEDEEAYLLVDGYNIIFA